MMVSLPRVVLGTMTFGGQLDSEAAAEAVARFADWGGSELDTAHIYTGGDAERILGRVLAADTRLAGSVATKVHPTVGGIRVSLAPDVVARQFAESLERLGLERVDLLYLHTPDNETPVERTLEACNRLHVEGRFRRLGLSNYASRQVEDCWRTCEREGWIAPSVYQGMYNGITRAVEAELFPCLRRFGMSFYAYNPLAGGLLTGKHRRYVDDPAPGRFRDNELYRPRFWTPAHFAAVDHLRSAVDAPGASGAAGAKGAKGAKGVSMAAAALRWLRHHSMLDAQAGDAIIIGASSISQLGSNLAALAAGPLPDALVRSFDEACEIARPEAPTYWRS